MSFSLHINATNRADKYQEVLPQIRNVVSGERDLIANLANISAVLKSTFQFFWVGFYQVKENQLVLGPFQGPLACTRINKGKGVCGSAWEQNKIIVVPNVDLFEGHIACSSETKSEIVLPIRKKSMVELILDIDSDQLDDFDEVDEKYLSELVGIVEELL